MNVRRAAFSIAECLVALVLLGAATALLAQFVAAAGTQRRVAEQHALALQETANLMERLFAISFVELTAERARELSLSEAARQQLPGARLEIAVHAADGEPAAKEVRISIRWLDRSRGPEAAADLTAWRHAEGRTD